MYIYIEIPGRFHMDTISLSADPMSGLRPGPPVTRGEEAAARLSATLWAGA